MLRERLAARLGHLETRIEQSLNGIPEGELSAADGERFFRLHGAYRGVSEAVADCFARTEAVEWARFSESRF